MKPIYLSFTLDLKFLDNHGNSEGVDIVFLYKLGTDILNFRLCGMVLQGLGSGFYVSFGLAWNFFLLAAQH